MPKTQKLYLAQRSHAANKLIYNVGVKKTHVAIEKKTYGGSSLEPSVEEEKRGGMRFNSLSKSLDANDESNEALQTVTAPYISIAQSNEIVESVDNKLVSQGKATLQKSNNLSAKQDHDDIVATFNILDSPYNFKSF